ncbi:hypothetical protein SAMN04488029_1536 [Reichenbachiella faecimaris]|uniref:Uncharacterized protein n=1 Tax=Reichenbachiella faecimaris TaxID=692418 RepID=A0A1W2G971_REIFA|nr:hypothetical protein [Reichenbachiella faecimaris]SMD33173.1 hypothetical protein SAMN04488029_1536 [Reichenbachiella faecimaris]
MKNLIKAIAFILIQCVHTGCDENEIIEPKSSDNAVNPFEWPLAEKVSEPLPSSQQGDSHLKDWY